MDVSLICLAHIRCDCQLQSRHMFAYASPRPASHAFLYQYGRSFTGSQLEGIFAEPFVYRCMELAIIHDLAECIVGDITPRCGISPDEKHRREEAAMKSITKLIPCNSEYVQRLFQVSYLPEFSIFSLVDGVEWYSRDC